MLTRRAQVAIELEAIEGTAETIVAADVILAYNPKFTPKLEMNKRKPVQSSLSNKRSIPGLRSAEMSFDVELVGTSAAGLAVHYADALKACGVQETLVASTSATYTPATTGVSSATLAMYMDGKVYKMWGARGTCKLAAEAGKPPMLSFTFTGADWSEADASLLTGTSLETTLPPIFASASLSIDSYSATVSKFELDLGNKVSLRLDANSSSGYKSAVITDRDPVMIIDPENIIVATEDFLGNWRSGSLMAFTTTLGSATGNTIEITAPAVQYHEISLADRDGISTLEINSLLVESSGDDEWQIQIT